MNGDRPGERTDAELLRESSGGEAFAELYRRHVASVYAWCRRRLEWAASDLALELRVVDELSYPEVAERLAIRPAAARLRVSRALRRLAAVTPKEEL